MNSYNKFFRAALLWLEMHYCKSGLFGLGVRVLEKYLAILDHRGRKEAIKFCKDSRHLLYRWLAASEYKSFVADSSRGKGILSKSLRFLARVDQSKRYPIIRLALTALYSSRELTLPVEVNVSSIVSPPSYDKGVIHDMRAYVDSFWRALGCGRFPDGHVPKAARWSKFHLSTKTGPTGLQSLWGAYADAFNIPDSLVKSISDVGGLGLSRKLCMIRDLNRPNPLDSYFESKSSSTREKSRGWYRKISPIQSQEGKTREVAIMDYWSQSALRGLHQYLFKWLRQIPQDCTFDQGSFVQKLPANGEPFYSIDLTAATDRFPIVLIEAVLSGRFPPEFVAAWRDIMVGYPFMLNNGESISYSVGNPMGAYSSWNSFALTHHFVMYYCCKVLKIDWSEAPYVILGDDVLIRQERLAKKYMEVIGSLGLEVSASKTHVSTSFREFAKRVLVDDIELTPFPISALWTTRRSLPLILGVVTSEVRKGWVTLKRTPDVLSDLFRVLEMPARYCRLACKNLNIAYDLLISLQGRVPAAEVLKPSLAKYYPGIRDDYDFMPVLKSVVMDAFARSSEPRDGKILGEMAVELVMMLTDPSFNKYLRSGVGKTSRTSFDLIYSLPCLRVHKYVEDKWLDVRKEAFDCIREGDWKLTLRALTIPLSDRIYYVKNEDIQPLASFTLAKILATRLASIEKDELRSESGVPPDTLSRITCQFGANASPEQLTDPNSPISHYPLVQCGSQIKFLSLWEAYNSG